MKKSIFKQIITIYLLLSLSLVAVLAIYFIHFYHGEQFRFSVEKTSLLWENLSIDIDDVIYTLNNPKLNERIKVLSKQLNAMIYIYDSNHRMIVRYERGYLDDTEYEQSELEKQILSQIHLSSLSVPGQHFQISKYFISSYPIMSESTIVGYFVCIKERAFILEHLKGFINDLWLLLLSVFGVAMIIFTIYIDRLVNPIRYLTKVVSLMNANNLSVPIIIQSNNEIGVLAKQFRQMSENLDKSFVDISSQKEILSSIINSIQQAIWLVDENATILMTNKHFEDFFEQIDAGTRATPPADCSRGESALSSKGLSDKMSLFDSLRHQDIIKIYKDTLAEKTTITREIEYENKTCLCTCTYLPIDNSVIFTMLDITSLKKVETIKKDLISNVSHELKTPLTTIKGFVETMLAELHPPFVDSQAQSSFVRGVGGIINYLEIIKRNTDRLILIINDLLTLSKLENSTEVVKQKIDIKTFMENIEAIFNTSLRDTKPSNLHFEYTPDIPPLFTDEFLLAQAIINLIDNALKYSGSEDITISVETLHPSPETRNQKPTHTHIIKVADKGIGIATKHLDRIFERFYVVDKSRSKRAGGTGLGLSIVKHIANLLDGDISVKSIENEGTTFTLIV